jgi:glycosyltransferase involved in cell wall biosynthesis
VKVAVIHSFYRAGLPSGENAAVVQQVETLRESGCEVLLIAKSSDEEVLRRLYPLRMAWIVGTGRGGSPLPALRDFRPQVVHAHNLFPNFGTAWLRRWSGPLVLGVHNYRMICTNGLFLRSGHLCTECLDGKTLRAIRHACYRGSRIASAPIAVANRGGTSASPVLSRADAVVMPSQTAAEFFIAAGLATPRCRVIPNPVKDLRTQMRPRSGWVSIGRLSAEKGHAGLLRQWPEGEPLKIIGDGPERPTLEAAASPSVSFAGVVDPAGVAAELSSAEALVLPSIVPEAAVTNAVIESFRAATPVLVREGTAAGRYVAEHGGGFVYAPRGTLRSALEAVRRDWTEMSATARANYERDFTEGVWLNRTLSLYTELIGR